MVIITRPGVTDAELSHICERVEALGLTAHVSRGAQRVVIGCVGDDQVLAGIPLLALPGIESVVPVVKPYKLASRECAIGGRSSVVRIGEHVTVGGEALAVIAGPCSVEGRDMLGATARAVAAAGATMLRGGAFKPRSSPYAFQGMGEPGLALLAEAREQTGLPVVTEVLDPRMVETVARYADVLQIGARNMQNFPLLAEVGRSGMPVLLKRGLSATVQELLMAAEYILANGNRDVVLCERGIRTYETTTRNTLDVGAIAYLKRETHLPVIADPSHAAGRTALVAPLAFSAIAAGADGLIVEVHPCPERARSDGDQSLDFAAFDAMMRQLGAFAEASGRTLALPGAPARPRVAV